MSNAGVSHSSGRRRPDQGEEMRLLRPLHLAIIATTLLNAGCASLIPGSNGIEEGRTFQITATASDKNRATRKALRQGAFKAEQLSVASKTRTRNGELESHEVRTKSPVYLYDYDEVNYSRRGSMHSVTVSATYLVGEKREIRALLADVHKTMRDVREIETQDPRRYAWTDEADHQRIGHVLAPVPVELRILPRPAGLERPWHVGVFLEALYDLNPPEDGPDGKDKGEWRVDTTWMGIMPWAWSPSAGLLVSTELGIADRVLISSDDDKYDDPEPAEIGFPDNEGWNPAAGLRVDAVLRNGWGVHYTARGIAWQGGDPDLWQRAEVFHEWYREKGAGPAIVGGRRNRGYRLSLGYTHVTGGVMDGYNSATLQFGLLF